MTEAFAEWKFEDAHKSTNSYRYSWLESTSPARENWLASRNLEVNQWLHGVKSKAAIEK